MAAISLRRLVALSRKESYQIIRDPSSVVIAFVLPFLLLIIFGHGVNLDSSAIRVGLFVDDRGAEAASLAATLAANVNLEVRPASSLEELERWLLAGDVRGFVVLPSDFSRQLNRPGATALVQVVTDGAEPNTANFVAAYVQGAWQSWTQQHALDHGVSVRAPIEVIPRYWFNSAAVSRHYIVPGSIAVIMTIVGALLTSLVVAREWERGTMEALLSTPATRAEFLLSKVIPYYLLGMSSMVVCLVVAVTLLDVPFRGSLGLLFLYTTLFLGSSLGLGLLLSTVTRNQFNAAQAALNAAFLPATMLSGFIYEIDGMPWPIRAVTYLIPARYFVEALQTLFQAGFVGSILFKDLLFLLASAALFLGLTAWRTKRRLD